MAGTRGKGTLLGLPERGKGASSRSVRGRVCVLPGCSTILSTFNASTTCWNHSLPNQKRLPYRF